MPEVKAQIENMQTSSQNTTSKTATQNPEGNDNQTSKLTKCDKTENGYCIIGQHKIRLAEQNVQLLNGVKYDTFTWWDKNGNLLTKGKDICSSIDNDKYHLSNYPQASIRFDNMTYGTESAGKIIVKLHYPAQQNEKVDLICLTVTSTSDSTGIPVILKEINPNSEIYKSVGLVLFTKDNSSDLNFGPNIHVALGDTVTATFMGATRTATITNATTKEGYSYGGTTPLSPSLYPAGTTRYNCVSNTDNDGICNEWKSGGSLTITYNGLVYTGPVCGGAGQDVCPAVGHKDIFLVVDSLSGFAPSTTSITDVQTAFKGAVTSPPLFNGRATAVYPHVYLHYETNTNTSCAGGTINFPNSVNSPPCDYDQIKSNDFWVGTAGNDSCSPNGSSCIDQKRQAFHFVLFAGTISEDTASSGGGEISGNDMVISLGAAGFIPSSVMEQEGTLMHELGHNLNLDHGGSDSMNCKPNYFSVMNYLFQFTNWVNRPLDFSQSAVGDNAGSTSLNTGSLVEGNGLGQTTGQLGLPTIYAVPALTKTMTTTAGTGTVPWDGDATTNTSAVTTNDFNGVVSGMTGCPGNPSTTLSGFKDWSNTALKYKFRSSANFEAGPSDMKVVRQWHLTQISNKTTGHTNGPPIGEIDAIHTVFDKNNPTVSDLSDSIKNLEKLSDKLDSQFTGSSADKTDTKTSISNLIYSLKQDSGYTNIQFNKNYYNIGETATITVTDPDATKAPILTVVSSIDSKQALVTANNKAVGPYTFTIKIGPDGLNVIQGDDSIAVTYDNHFTSSAQITNSTQP